MRNLDFIRITRIYSKCNFKIIFSFKNKMMTKNEHIEFWVNNSNDDWITTNTLFETKRFMHCLFFAHLTLEKLCKAIWIKENMDNIPPKIHNLLKLINQTQIKLNDSQKAYLLEINRFQLEGRYPDYINSFSKLCDQDYTKTNLIKIDQLRLCLIKHIQ